MYLNSLPKTPCDRNYFNNYFNNTCSIEIISMNCDTMSENDHTRMQWRIQERGIGVNTPLSLLY